MRGKGELCTKHILCLSPGLATHSSWDLLSWEPQVPPLWDRANIYLPRSMVRFRRDSLFQVHPQSCAQYGNCRLERNDISLYIQPVTTLPTYEKEWRAQKVERLDDFRERFPNCIFLNHQSKEMSSGLINFGNSVFHVNFLETLNVL